MAKKKFKRIIRQATAEEKKRHAQIRKQVMQEFPPKQGARKTSQPGIPSDIRHAREAKGLSWYAVAKLAGIPNSSTVWDIECGLDAKLSNVEAVANVLGLRLELVAQDV